MLVDLYPVDDLFDQLDITLEEVLTILVRGGHVQLPDYLSYEEDARFRIEE